MGAINRHQRHDDAKPDEVDEDRKENHQNGRFSHEVACQTRPHNRKLNLNCMERVYLPLRASQEAGRCWRIRPPETSRNLLFRVSDLQLVIFWSLGFGIWD